MLHFKTRNSQFWNSVCSWSVFWNLSEMVTSAPNAVSTFYIKQKGNNSGHLWKSLHTITTSDRSLPLSPVLSVLKCHVLVFILVHLLLEKGDLCLHMLMGGKLNLQWVRKSSFLFVFSVTVLELDLLAWPKVNCLLPVDLQLSTQTWCLRPAL